MNTTRGPIVVGVDESEPSLHALRYATELADALEVELVAVHVHPEGFEGFLSSTADPMELPFMERAKDSLDEVARQEVQQRLASATFRWRFVQRVGDRAEELQAVAGELGAFMVVVGSRGRGMSEMLHRLLFGSVTHRVLHYPSAPVLIVQPSHSAAVRSTPRAPEEGESS